MQVGELLDGIGEGLLFDLGLFRPDAIADGAVVNGQNSRFMAELQRWLDVAVSIRAVPPS